MQRTNRTRLIACMFGLTLLPLAAHAGEVQQREATQQHRIAQGVHSGQITAGGANHLEHREQRINQSRRSDLRANGGHLTARQYHHLNQRQAKLSRRIYIDKHNRATQPGVPRQ